MTTLALEYLKHQETKRSNLAKEAETNRSNLAKEKETNRSNLVTEAETNRSNVVRETETNRHNLATEYTDIIKNTLPNTPMGVKQVLSTALLADGVLARVNPEVAAVLKDDLGDIIESAYVAGTGRDKITDESDLVTSVIDGIEGSGVTDLADFAEDVAANVPPWAAPALLVPGGAPIVLGYTMTKSLLGKKGVVSWAPKLEKAFKHAITSLTSSGSPRRTSGGKF